MTRTGVRRLICISALGVGDSRGPASKDKDRQEAAIRASLLDWVVVRPAMLTSDPPRRRVRATVDLAGVNGGKIARADVAQFVFEQLTTDTWLRRTPVILWRSVVTAARRRGWFDGHRG